MTKKYEHGFYGSTAITNAIQQTIDALVAGEAPPVFTFTIAPKDQAADHTYGQISFGLEQEDETLRWRIHRGGGCISGLDSESIFTCEDSMDELEYQRAGLAAACELSSLLHGIASRFEAQIYLTNITKP